VGRRKEGLGWSPTSQKDDRTCGGENLVVLRSEKEKGEKRVQREA